jgi:hypothetical protein
MVRNVADIRHPEDAIKYRANVIAAAYVIPGWMWPIELGWLFDMFAASRSHLEVGSFCGKSLFVTACGMGQQARANKQCISVDPLGDSAAGGTWEAAVLKATCDEILARSSMAVECWKMGSVVAQRHARRADLRFDSVFIDGNHHYAEVKADIEGWLPFVRAEGIIAGHDFWPRDAGVMDAVHEVFEGKFQVFAQSRIWWTRVAP